ncbi:DNA phosphorothioation-dependent restriction protein DptG [Pontibacillus litoralis]|uniref:DNA phosphorothioation-dependent restriction protein DptG n=1 Tax=Pontibacillus litoralis JSM 072002 TaxID=1385512 RepID=A0A0A5G7G4_9BACI|nr:DNA phosphorothioation-dependent restriction protein DptG [Pontibacillus litoralis]KGX87015.1 DNA phosphorothioation-dependent restriction protein DptG [Pontibacillus litoralis JSM 072002]
MSYQNNLSELKKAMRIKDDKQKLTHVRNTKAMLLPFTSRATERAKFKNGFSGVVGEFTRLLLGYELKHEMDKSSINEKILKKVDVSQEDEPYFTRLINGFLFDNENQMKIFHPHMMLYLPLSKEKDVKGEKEIAHFLKDLIGDDLQEIQSVLEKDHHGHLITNLIIDHLDNLKDKETKKKYTSKLPHIADLLKEDLQFIVNHKEYFVENVNLFLAYYYFYYITQLTLKFNQMFNASYVNENKMVYLLDWEGASKSRPSYKFGYQKIKHSSASLIIHYDCQEHLNYIFGTSGLCYPEFLDLYVNKPQNEQEEIIDAIQCWIKEYRYHLALPNIEIPNTFKEVVVTLKDSLNEGFQLGTMQGVSSRFKIPIDEIGKKYFLKTRGSLGYMLNLSQDLLLLLTAVSVKNERKPLKQVFQSLEERGVFLDRHSKEAVVALYDQLNLLDKKSDSGDAQYVKPIL